MIDTRPHQAYRIPVVHRIARLHFCAALLLLLLPMLPLPMLLLACEPAAPTGVQAVDGFGAGADASVDDEPLAFAVVSTDRTVSTVALLDPGGEVLAEDFIHSGSAPVGLVTALSGDVVLPTRSGDPGILTLLDRFRTDVVTRVDPATGRVLGQVRTQAPNADSDTASYSSNPHDYVYLGPHDAWVSRFEPNYAAGQGDPDRGNDLLHLDPGTFTRGARIDFSHLTQRGQRHNPDTGQTQTVDVYARPSGMVRLGDRLVVGLAGLSQRFDAVGQGRVALVDPDAGSAEGFDLPGLQNCDSVQPVPDTGDRVVVACSGFYRGVQRQTAGVALLSLRDDALRVEALWRAADDPTAPLSVAGVVPVGGSVVVAMAPGQAASSAADGEPAQTGTHDTVYLLDLESGEQNAFFTAAGRFKVGAGAYNARRGLLLLPDASVDAQGRPTGGVRLFARREDGSFEPGRVIALDPVLPPWQVAPL